MPANSPEGSHVSPSPEESLVAPQLWGRELRRQRTWQWRSVNPEVRLLERIVGDARFIPEHSIQTAEAAE
jgi:hypothetical protein